MVKSPNIYDHHSYREYLKSWLAYNKSTKSGPSLRALAKLAKISASQLSEVLSGRRSMSTNIFNSITPALNLKARDLKFFKNLVQLADGKSVADREQAFKNISKFESYRARHANEIKAHEMISAWHYFAIWQLANLPTFQLNPIWIRRQFKHKLSTEQIRDCLRFLFANDFLVKDENGKIRTKEKFLRADSEVLKIAMANGHSEHMELAAKSIYNTPSEQRHLLNYTLSLAGKDFVKVKDILESTLKSINKVSDETKVSDGVYNVCLYAFPLTSPLTEDGDSDETNS
jgi:uncharacterized protein (TIGR02147 family)